MREEEENREADKAFADKIEARNALESYVYSLRTSMQALPILISPDSLNWLSPSSSHLTHLIGSPHARGW